MSTNYSHYRRYRRTEHLSGLEFHPGRNQPWTVWLRERTYFYATREEAVSLYDFQCTEPLMLWNCPGRTGIGGSAHEASAT